MLVLINAHCIQEKSTYMVEVSDGVWRPEGPPIWQKEESSNDSKKLSPVSTKQPKAAFFTSGKVDWLSFVTIERERKLSRFFKLTTRSSLRLSIYYRKYCVGVTSIFMKIWFMEILAVGSSTASATKKAGSWPLRPKCIIGLTAPFRVARKNKTSHKSAAMWILHIGWKLRS